LFDDIAQAPEGGAAHWISPSDGVQIRVAEWRGEGSAGTVLVFPGRTEYIEKYGLVAGDLVEQGFSVAVIDWRGQGIAGRVHPVPTMGHVGTFADYQRDVAALLAHVREIGLPEPYYLLGHSMGGCIGLRSLNEGLPVRAAVFSAPMWGIRLSNLMRPVAWGVSSLARRVGLAHLIAPGQVPDPFVLRVSFEENTLTSDPAMFRRMQDDLTAHPDLALGGPSLNWLNEALRETRALSRLPSPRVPVLTFLGTEEAIVDADRIRARMKTWVNGRLEMVKGARHEVLMEGTKARRALTAAAAAHFRAHA
jgi:lysophospholipase